VAQHIIANDFGLPIGTLDPAAAGLVLASAIMVRHGEAKWGNVNDPRPLIGLPPLELNIPAPLVRRRQHVDAHALAVASGPSVVEPEAIGLGAQLQSVAFARHRHWSRHRHSLAPVAARKPSRNS
jgi:hypothetical protein